MSTSTQGVRRRLAEERRKRGWTQMELASRAGVAAQVVSSLETGYLTPQPTAGMLQKLARVLRVPASELLQPVTTNATEAYRE